MHALAKGGHTSGLHSNSRAVLTFAEQSSEPLMTRGGPLRRGQQLLTKASCSAIFFICCPVSASQALSDLSGEADTSFSPSVLQCSSSTAFLWPAQHGWSHALSGPDACCNRAASRSDMLISCWASQSGQRTCEPSGLEHPRLLEQAELLAAWCKSCM